MGLDKGYAIIESDSTGILDVERDGRDKHSFLILRSGPKLPDGLRFTFSIVYGTRNQSHVRHTLLVWPEAQGCGSRCRGYVRLEACFEVLYVLYRD